MGEFRFYWSIIRGSNSTSNVSLTGSVRARLFPEISERQEQLTQILILNKTGNYSRTRHKQLPFLFKSAIWINPVQVLCLLIILLQLCWHLEQYSKMNQKETILFVYHYKLVPLKSTSKKIKWNTIILLNNVWDLYTTTTFKSDKFQIINTQKFFPTSDWCTKMNRSKTWIIWILLDLLWS